MNVSDNTERGLRIIQRELLQKKMLNGRLIGSSSEQTAAEVRL